MELTIENIQLFSAASAAMAYVVIMLWIFCDFMATHIYFIVVSFIVLIAGIYSSRMIDNIGFSAFNNQSNLFLSDTFNEIKIGGCSVENAVTSVMRSVDEIIINEYCKVQMADFLDRQTILTLKDVGDCYYKNNTVKGFDKLKSRYNKS